jgi:hypothetical protein
VIKNKFNRIHRINFILTKLSKGQNLTTQKLAEQFETTTMIQLYKKGWRFIGNISGTSKFVLVFEK